MFRPLRRPRFGAAVVLLIQKQKKMARGSLLAPIFVQNALFCSIAGAHKMGPPHRPLPRLYGCGPLRGCGPPGRALRMGSPDGPPGLGLVTPPPTKSTFCSTGRIGARSLLRLTSLRDTRGAGIQRHWRYGITAAPTSQVTLYAYRPACAPAAYRPWRRFGSRPGCCG